MSTHTDTDTDTDAYIVVTEGHVPSCPGVDSWSMVRRTDGTRVGRVLSYHGRFAGYIRNGWRVPDADTLDDAVHAIAKLLATVAPPLALALALALPASAHDGPHADTYPIIGTPAYDAGCHIIEAWEDGSAMAYCPEDGAYYGYEPDPPAPGWHVVK